LEPPEITADPPAPSLSSDEVSPQPTGRRIALVRNTAVEPTSRAPENLIAEL
jgi:hypothetical protein